MDKYLCIRNDVYTYPFGSSVYLNDLVSGLHKYGIGTSILQMVGSQEPPHIIKFNGGNIISIPCASFKDFIRIWPGYVPKDSTFVHLNNLDCLPKEQLPYKLTGTVHTNNFLFKREASQLFVDKILPRMEKVVVVNDVYIKTFKGITAKLLKINNFIDTDFFKFSKKPPRSWPYWNLLFPSRQIRSKGVFFALDIASELHLKYGWEGTLSLAGEINAAVLEYATTRKVPSMFLGYKDHYLDMPKLYTEFDLSLFPSLSEACSLGMIESLSTGCPTVATDTPSIDEMIQNKVNGLLLPLNVHLWCKEIYNLSTQPELYLSLKESGRATAANRYNLKKSVNEYVNMWQTITN